MHLLPKLLQLLDQSDVVTGQLRYDLISSVQPTLSFPQLTLQALHASTGGTLATLPGQTTDTQCCTDPEWTQRACVVNTYVQTQQSYMHACTHELDTDMAVGSHAPAGGPTRHSGRMRGPATVMQRGINDGTAGPTLEGQAAEVGCNVSQTAAAMNSPLQSPTIVGTQPNHATAHTCGYHGNQVIATQCHTLSCYPFQAPLGP